MPARLLHCLEICARACLCVYECVHAHSCSHLTSDFFFIKMEAMRVREENGMAASVHMTSAFRRQCQDVIHANAILKPERGFMGRCSDYRNIIYKHISTDLYIKRSVILDLEFTPRSHIYG